MNNIVIPYPNIENFKLFIENDIDGFLIGIEGYSENFNYLIKEKELKKICNILKDKNKKIYISLNKIYFNHEIKNLESLIYTISKLDVNAIVFSDMAVLNIVKQNNLNINLIYYSKLITNSKTINFLKKRGVSGFFCSCEITIDEFIDISKKTNTNCFIKLFGFINIATSSRKLISNYFKHVDIKKDPKRKYYFKEKLNDDLYTIIESDNTNFFTGKILNGIMEYKKLINQNINSTIILDDYMIEEATFYNVIEAFIALKRCPTDEEFAEKLKLVIDSNCYNNTYDGFLNKKTIYKVKNNE